MVRLEKPLNESFFRQERHNYSTCMFLEFACLVLGKSFKHILPNGGLMVIYHAAATISKKITNKNTSKMFGDWKRRGEEWQVQHAQHLTWNGLDMCLKQLSVLKFLSVYPV